MRRSTFAASFLLLSAVVPTAETDAAVLHVPSEYPTVQAGIDATAPGDTVEIACGTYAETGIQIRHQDVHLRPERDVPGCVTIDGMGQQGVFVIRASQVTIEGIRITGGVANVGGGIYAYEGSTLEVFDCVIEGNRAQVNGGGLCIGGSTVTLVGTRVTGNDAQGTRPRFGGGALHVRGLSFVKVSNCTFADNTGPTPGVMVAGTDPDVSFDRCIFANGACPVLNHSPVTDSCFFGCGATGTGSFSADPLFCDPAAGDYRVGGASPCLPGGNAAGLLIGSEALGCGTSPPARVQVTTMPAGQPVVVDGLPYRSPSEFTWPLYSRHVIEVLEATSLSAGDRYRFDEWGDGGRNPKVVFVGGDGLRFDAGLVRQYALTTVVDGPGSVVPSEGWFDAGTGVDVRSVPDPGMHVVEWRGTGPGSYTGFDDTASVVMDGAVTQRAAFAPIAHDFTISASATTPFALAEPPTQGLRSLYLWVTCSNGGLSAFQAGVSGSLQPIAFVPVAGVLNAGSATDLLLAVSSCPVGTSAHTLLGYWLVDDFGGDLCLGPSAFGPATSVECDAPFTEASPRVAGFSSAGQPPCLVGVDQCGNPRVPRESGGGSAPTADGSRAVPFGPNPFVDVIRFRASSGVGELSFVAIHDVTGRALRRLEARGSGALLEWDGRDASGRPLPAGIYFARIVGQTGSRTVKVTRVRPR